MLDLGQAAGEAGVEPGQQLVSAAAHYTEYCHTHTPPGQVVGGDGVEDVDHGPGVGGAARHLLRGLQPLENTHNRTCSVKKGIFISASKMSIRRFVITEKAPTRAFSWPG